MTLISLVDDINLDEQEEKARLIAQVMELQNTLDGKNTVDKSTSISVFKISIHSFIFLQTFLRGLTVLRKKI